MGETLQAQGIDIKDNLHDWVKNEIEKTYRDTKKELNNLKNIIKDNKLEENLTLDDVKTILKEAKDLRYKRSYEKQGAGLVMSLQIALKKLSKIPGNENLDPGKIDGVYMRESDKNKKQYANSSTRKAVKSFQEKNGIDVDGWAGPQTLGKILEQLNGLSEVNVDNNTTNEVKDITDISIEDEKVSENIMESVSEDKDISSLFTKVNGLKTLFETKLNSLTNEDQKSLLDKSSIDKFSALFEKFSPTEKTNVIKLLEQNKVVLKQDLSNTKLLNILGWKYIEPNIENKKIAEVLKEEKTREAILGLKKGDKIFLDEKGTKLNPANQDDQDVINNDTVACFMEYNNETYYNSQGKQDNIRGKLDDKSKSNDPKDSYFLIEGKFTKAEENQLIKDGPGKGGLIVNGKLLDRLGVEVKKDEAGNYLIKKGFLGLGSEEKYKVEGGKLVKADLTVTGKSKSKNINITKANEMPINLINNENMLNSSVGEGGVTTTEIDPKEAFIKDHFKLNPNNTEKNTSKTITDNNQSKDNNTVTTNITPVVNNTINNNNTVTTTENSTTKDFSLFNNGSILEVNKDEESNVVGNKIKPEEDDRMKYMNKILTPNVNTSETIKKTITKNETIKKESKEINNISFKSLLESKITSINNNEKIKNKGINISIGHIQESKVEGNSFVDFILNSKNYVDEIDQEFIQDEIKKLFPSISNITETSALNQTSLRCDINPNKEKENNNTNSDINGIDLSKIKIINNIKAPYELNLFKDNKNNISVNDRQTFSQINDQIKELGIKDNKFEIKEDGTLGFHTFYFNNNEKLSSIKKDGNVTTISFNSNANITITEELKNPEKTEKGIKQITILFDDGNPQSKKNTKYIIKKNNFDIGTEDKTQKVNVAPEEINEQIIKKVIEDLNEYGSLAHNNFVARWDQTTNKILIERKNDVKFILDKDDQNYNNPEKEIKMRFSSYLKMNLKKYNEDSIYLDKGDLEVNVEEKSGTKRISIKKIALDPKEYIKFKKDALNFK